MGENSQDNLNALNGYRGLLSAHISVKAYKI